MDANILIREVVAPKVAAQQCRALLRYVGLLYFHFVSVFVRLLKQQLRYFFFAFPPKLEPASGQICEQQLPCQPQI